MPSPAPALIIGAGPAGLSVAACLKREGIEPVVLEKTASVGHSWRNHYRRLHLHTVKRFSTLPYHPWPKHVPTYPSRAQVVEYLESYADAFLLQPRFHHEVRSARYVDGRWRLQTSGGEYEGSNVVVATGYNKKPNVPEWPGTETFRGALIHSSDYRDGQPYRGKRVMVVGIGNSGGEIAIDLWEHGARSTCVAVRSPVHVLPRDLLGTPAQVTGILTSRLPPHIADRITLALLDRIYGDLSPYGLRRPAKGPLATLLSEGRVPLLDVGTIELIRQGHIDVVPGLDRFTETGVVFVDGSERELDAVVLATGYRAALDEVLGDATTYVDARGYPLCHGEEFHGEEAPTPGLYFVGYRNPPIGQLNDIAKEARRVAKTIAAKQRGPTRGR